MDPTKASNPSLLDELLGFESREHEDDDKTVVLDRQDSSTKLAVADVLEDPDGDRPTGVPPGVGVTAFAAVIVSDAVHELEPEALEDEPDSEALEEDDAEELEPDALQADTDDALAQPELESVTEEPPTQMAPPVAPVFDAPVVAATAMPAVAAVAASPSASFGAGSPSGSMRAVEVSPTPSPVSQVPSSQISVPPPKPMRAMEASYSGAPGSVPQPLSRNDLEDAWVGELIDGRYRVLRLLGVGGIGLVYLCRHELLEKPVALKVLRPEYVLHEDLNERFMNEARAASSIKSPRIVDTLDVGVLPTGAPYFVMEYVEGETLASLLDREGHLSLARSVDVARQMAEGLEAAHAAGVVHRDLKPENVFLAHHAEGLYVKIFDFGIAKVASARKRLTYVGAVFGTPHYMSPEQARGEQVDARSDLYALGIMLFEMVAGNVPFDGEEPLSVMAQHVDRAPPLMASIAGRPVPAPLEAIVARCLAKDPRDRYSSATELLFDLNTLSEPDLHHFELSYAQHAPMAAPPIEMGTPAPAVAFAHLPVDRPETLHAHVVPSAAPSGRKKGRMLWAFMGLIALGGTGLLAFRHLSERPMIGAGLTAEARVKPSPAPVSNVETVENRPSEEGGIKVDFVLAPIDAHLFLGEEDLGPMPVSIHVDKDKPVTLTVRRQGYVTRRVVVDGTETRIVIGLVSVEKSSKRRKR
ncbi:MAG TPA: serine/threonine-protein kinase [Polyangiaceae bacterium]|nr:serine/threonine-protein kinase [Polyangiaceae bacterium]